MIPGKPANHSQVSEGIGLALAVAEFAEKGQRHIQGLDGLVVVIGQGSQRTQVVQCVGLALPVAQIAVDVQCLLLGLCRAQIVAGQPPHDPQLVQGVGRAQHVAETPGGRDRGGVPGYGLGPGTVLSQHGGEGGGEGDDSGMLADSGTWSRQAIKLGRSVRAQESATCRSGRSDTGLAGL